MIEEIARLEIAEGADEEQVTELVDYTIRGFQPDCTPFVLEEIEEGAYEIGWDARERGEKA